MAAVLAWLTPRSAAVRSLRLRACDSSGRKDLVSPVSWAQFVPLLNNITNEHDRQLVARKMQPLLMAAWAEPEYPHVQHDYTRYRAHLCTAIHLPPPPPPPPFPEPFLPATHPVAICWLIRPIPHSSCVPLMGAPPTTLQSCHSKDVENAALHDGADLFRANTRLLIEVHDFPLPAGMLCRSC